MAHKWQREGAPVPLFDRLIDDHPEFKEELVSKKILTREELRDSILLELKRILNTRCTLKADVYKDIGPTLATFGIPELFGLFDTSQFDATSSLDRSKMQKVIERAIAAFEPRLRDIRVTVDAFHNTTQSLSLVVRAHMVVGDVLEPVSFPLEVGGQPRPIPI